MESEHTLHPIDPYQDKADPWSSHSVILAMLKDFPIGTRILDVGTATGIVGRMCRGRGFLLRGVEPVARWAKASRPYYAAIATSDLAHTADEFLRDHQVVICADVLEHMADPQEQLGRLAELQQEGTTFLISLPNIANIWVRVNLLFGRFSYADRGILDRTHLRFFTLRSAKALLSQAGLQINSTVTTPIPLNLIHPFFINHPIGRGLHSSLAALTRMLPRLLGYQFVFRAVKEIE